MNKTSKIISVILGYGLLTAMPLRGPLQTPVAQAKPKAAPILTTGFVKAVAKVPRRGRTPYKDAVLAVRLSNVRAVNGKWAKKDILVYLWGMQNNKRTPATTYRPGRKIKIALVPWDDVERRYGRYNRWDLSDRSAFTLPAYWGVPR